MAENKSNSSKTKKTYEDTATGQTAEHDSADPTVADRVARGELREVSNPQR